MNDEGDSKPSIEDLFDFYQRWPDLRPRMVRLAASACLEAEDRNILGTMIELVDRVGPNDLSRDG